VCPYHHGNSQSSSSLSNTRMGKKFIEIQVPFSDLSQKPTSLLWADTPQVRSVADIKCYKR
jgi:hypothetical protein